MVTCIQHELGAWPICPACKRAKEDQKEQKKQTALQQELLQNQLEASKAEERRQREADERQRRHEEEMIRIEKEKAKKEIEIAQKKEFERKNQEAKKRINEISEKILLENKGMLVVGFSFQNNNQFEKNKLIDKKESNGFYLDINELVDSSIILDKIDLVGYKKITDKWENYNKYDNGKFLYYLSSQDNEVEKILFLKKEEVEDFERIITNVDNEIIRQEKERKKAEQDAKEKQEKENEINTIISTAISFNNQSAFNTNQKLLLLYKFTQQFNKSLKNNFQFFIDILNNQKKKVKILKYLKQTQDILTILSSMEDKFEDFTKDLLLFENTLFGRKKKFNAILKTHNINNEQLASYTSKFVDLKNFLPKTKKYIYFNILNANIEVIVNESNKITINDNAITKKLNQSKINNFSTGIEYIDSIFDSGKFVIITFIISLLSSICFIAGISSFNFVVLALIGHMITLPLLIYIRLKHKIKILPIIIIFFVSFIFALVFAKSGDPDVTTKSNIKIEKNK